MEHHPTDAEKQTQGLCGATSPPAFMTNVSGGLSPAGERNRVDLTLGGAKSRPRLTLMRPGEGSPQALFCLERMSLPLKINVRMAYG